MIAGLNGITGGLVFGSLVAFLLAVFAVGIDMQDSIRSRLGEVANASLVRTWQGWVVLAAWGIFDAVLYLVIISHPDWARNTFNFDVSNNKVMAGVAVGISAVFLIRSKLAKVGTVEVGGEYAYLWSRAFALEAVNRVRVRTRIENEKRYAEPAKDVNRYPTLFTDLAAWLLAQADGKPDGVKSRIVNQVGEIRKQSEAAGKNPDQDPSARKYLFGLAIDYFRPSDLGQFATVFSIG